MLSEARLGAARIGLAGSVIVAVAALLRLAAQSVPMQPAVLVATPTPMDMAAMSPGS